MKDHPGGKRILLKVAGQDATQQFANFHAPSVLTKYSPELQIGVVDENASASAPQSSAPESSGETGSFGEMVPFGDPCWYQDWNVPYYNDSHRRLRKEMRDFVEKNITPFCEEWDEAKQVPADLFRKFADAGVLAGVIGPPWPTKYADYPRIIGGVKPEEVS